MGFIKPICFTAAFAGCSFVGCLIWEYESRLRERERLNPRRDFGSGWVGDSGPIDLDSASSPWPRRDSDRRKSSAETRGVLDRVNSWWNGLLPAQKVILGIISSNGFIFLLLRIGVTTAYAPNLIRYFTLSTQSPMSSLFLSSFSHYSLIHFSVNMYVLWSLAPFAHVMGRHQFVAFYTTAGVVASCASVLFRQLPLGRLATASLGASGCIYGVIGAFCLRFPEVKFGVPLLTDLIPEINFKASSLWPALLTFDAIGLLLGFRVFDHAAHLGGILFGLGYTSMNFDSRGQQATWTKLCHLFWPLWARFRASFGGVFRPPPPPAEPVG